MTDSTATPDDFEELIPLDEQESEEDLSGTISFKNAVSQSADWTLETINGQLEKGNIELSPGFQRRSAWDDVRKSRLIESIIVGMPVPNIVIAESKERRGGFIVIDGKQRLIAINDYYSGQFALRGLDIRRDLNGCKYDELPPGDRDYLDNSTLRSTLIKNWSDENFLYAIFFRLNSGSLPLSPQELRKALVGGRLIDRIERYINESQSFHAVFGDQPDRRMRDSELVLRFLAFDTFYLHYDGNLKRFLDQTTAYYEAEDRGDELEDRLGRLDCALSATVSIFGAAAFKKWTGDAYEKRMNRAVFDCVAHFFAEQEVAAIALQHAKAVVDAFCELCIDPAFKQAIERTTKTKDATSHRIESWGRSLAGVIGATYNPANALIVK